MHLLLLLMSLATAVQPRPPVAEVAGRAVGAVVHVQVAKAAAVDPRLVELGWERLGPRTVERQASGSGVIVTPGGRVLTNQHVVDGAVSITLVLSDQRRLPARVVGADPRTDVAVLQLEPEGDYPWLPLGDSDDVAVGDFVVAVGSPFDFQSTVTLGVVSAKGRRGLAEHDIQDFIQTDAAVNPGNSGGPLLDMHARIIGLNTAIYAPGGEQNSGVSFAIPSNMLVRIRADLEASGLVRRAWVGLFVRTAVDVDGDITRRGAEIMRVVADSPAERAGLRRGDIAVAVDGEAIPSADALVALVGARGPGTALEFTVIRDDEPVTATVRSAETRSPGVEGYVGDALPWSGLLLAEPSDELRSHFGVPLSRGVLVIRVEPESSADTLGLLPGDVVTAVFGTPVEGLSHLQALLEDDRGMVVLSFLRGGEEARAILPAP